MNDSLVVYRPSGRVRAATASTYPTLVKLEGAPISIIDNTKPNFHAFAERLGAALRAEFGMTTERAHRFQAGSGCAAAAGRLWPYRAP